MNLKKIFAFLTIASLIGLITVVLLIAMNPAFVPALYFKIFILDFIASISFSGLYLMESKKIENIKIKILMYIFALGLISFSSLISFNIIDFSSTWNLMFSCGIIYLLVVQLIASKRKTSGGFLFKTLMFLMICSNLFLSMFFMSKWEFSELSMWIDLAVLISIGSFVLALLMSRKKEIKAS